MNQRTWKFWAFISIGILQSSLANSQEFEPWRQLLNPESQIYQSQPDPELELPYPWMLNRDSEQMRQWQQEQSRRTLKSLNSKPELWRAVRQQFRRVVGNKPRVVYSENLGMAGVVEVIDQGLGEPVQVMHRQGEGHVRVLYETPYWNPYSLSLLSVDVSPEMDYLLIPLSRSGSTDEKTVLVYDFVTAKLIDQFVGYSERGVWVSNSEYIAHKYSNNESIDAVLWRMSPAGIVETAVSSDHIGYANDESDRYALMFSVKEGEVHLRDIQNGRYFRHPVFQEGWLEYGEEGRVVLSENQKTIHIVDLNGEEPVVATVPTGLNQLKSVTRHGEYYVVSGAKGLRQYLLWYDFVAQLQRSLELPLGVGAKVVSIDRNHWAQLELRSSVVDKKTFFYDLNSGEIWNATKTLPVSTEVLQQLMEFDSKNKWSFEEIWATSKDGTQVPALVVRREDMNFNGATPCLVEVYGGFGISNVRVGYVNTIHHMFLDQKMFPTGGMYVLPAPRGGGEFGEDWHNQAIRLNKHKTFEDTNAIVELLQSKGYTSARKTVLMGTSNGGYVVAGSSMTRPDLYKVVVPINGVLDQVNKWYLDFRFSRGWAYEYGDLNDSPEMAQYLRNISPLNAIGRNGAPPKYIIVSGQRDTRVNPIHSMSFIEKLQTEFPESQSVLISTRHGGHWVESVSFQDVTGYRSSSRMWTEIIHSVLAE